MTIYKTYCFKIKDPNQGKVEKLRKLAGLFRKGLNYCLEMAKQMKPQTSFGLHPHVYTFLRAIGLPSQIALSCRDKAFEAYQSHLVLKELDTVWHRAPHFDAVPGVSIERCGNLK